MRKIINWIKQLFIKPKQTHFIQGSEILPHPLSKDDEHAALLKWRDKDLQARDLLIEHNLRLVVYIAKRYETNPIFMEDIISIGTIGLIKAVNTFNMDKNIKLVTYASRCIENEILMHLRKKNRRKHELSFDEPLNVDYDGNELLLSDIYGTPDNTVTKQFYDSENKKDLLIALEGLDEEEKMILKLRYGIECEQKTQKDIAIKLGISQSYISRLEKKILYKLKTQLFDKIQ